MKKFSKIYENIISNEEVTDIFSDFLIDFDCNIKIYDYFFERGSLFKNVQNINEKTRHAKVGVITFNGKDNFQDMSISNYGNIGFNSSRFLFPNKSVDDLRDIFDGLVQAISRIDQYEGKIWFKDNKIMVYLLGDKVDNQLLIEKEERRELKKWMYDEFTKFTGMGNQSNIEPFHISNLGSLILYFYYDERMFNVLQLLYGAETEDGNNYRKKDDILRIRKYIENKGYRIKLSNYKEPDRGHRGSCKVGLEKI